MCVSRCVVCFECHLHLSDGGLADLVDVHSCIAHGDFTISRVEFVEQLLHLRHPQVVLLPLGYALVSPHRFSHFNDFLFYQISRDTKGEKRKKNKRSSQVELKPKRAKYNGMSIVTASVIGNKILLLLSVSSVSSVMWTRRQLMPGCKGDSGKAVIDTGAPAAGINSTTASSVLTRCV